VSLGNVVVAVYSEKEENQRGGQKPGRTFTPTMELAEREPKREGTRQK